MIQVPGIQPGDAIFARTNNFYGFIIRFGQAIRWWKYRKWNHMAIVDEISADGQIWVIQMAKHGEKVRIEEVAPKGILKWAPLPEGLDRNRVVEYARKKVGIDYGVMTIISIAINLLLPRQFNLDIRSDDTLICSALVARAWEHGGWDCPTDPFEITPAEFDQALGGGGTKIQ